QQPLSWFVHHTKPNIELALPAARVGPAPGIRPHLLDLYFEHCTWLQSSDGDRTAQSMATRKPRLELAPRNARCGVGLQVPPSVEGATPNGVAGVNGENRFPLTGEASVDRPGLRIDAVRGHGM